MMVGGYDGGFGARVGCTGLAILIYCPGTAQIRNLIGARRILSLANKLENVRIGILEGLWHKMTSFERRPGLLSVGWMA